jgi:hypothetical protein
MLVTEWIQRKLPLIADPYVKRKSYINKSFAEDATRLVLSYVNIGSWKRGLFIASL